MNIKRKISYLFIALVLVAGCTTRYAIHGENILKDSNGDAITNSLYRVETKRLFWYDNRGDVIWLITKDRPNVRLQFDEVEGVEPLAAELRPTDMLVIQSEYPDTIAGVIANCDSIDDFAEGVAQVSIFAQYKDDGWGAPGFSQAYLAPSNAPYAFKIKRHKLDDAQVPKWVRESIEYE